MILILFFIFPILCGCAMAGVTIPMMYALHPMYNIFGRAAHAVGSWLYTKWVKNTGFFLFISILSQPDCIILEKHKLFKMDKIVKMMLN